MVTLGKVLEKKEAWTWVWTIWTCKHEIVPSTFFPKKAKTSRIRDRLRHTGVFWLAGVMRLGYTSLVMKSNRIQRCFAFLHIELATHEGLENCCGFALQETQLLSYIVYKSISEAGIACEGCTARTS